MALAFVPPLALTLWWQGDTAGGAAFAYGAHVPIRKVMGWITMLRGGQPALDIGVPVVLALLVAWLLRSRALALDPRAALGAVLIALACTLMPATVFGSWAADERLAPVAAMVAALSLRSTGDRRAATVLAATALVLFGTRVAEMTWRWTRQEAAYARALAALDHLPRGARVHAVVLTDGCHAGWTTNGWAHLPNLAIVRRDALVNAQWPMAGRPLLTVGYPGIPARLLHEPSQQVATFGCGAPTLAALHARLAEPSLRRFQYLWVLRTRGLTPLWPGHRAIWRDDDSALYRIG